MVRPYKDCYRSVKLGPIIVHVCRTARLRVETSSGRPVHPPTTPKCRCVKGKDKESEVVAVVEVWVQDLLARSFQTVREREGEDF